MSVCPKVWDHCMGSLIYSSSILTGKLKSLYFHWIVCVIKLSCVYQSSDGGRIPRGLSTSAALKNNSSFTLWAEWMHITVRVLKVFNLNWHKPGVWLLCCRKIYKACWLSDKVPRCREPRALCCPVETRPRLEVPEGYGALPGPVCREECAHAWPTWMG
jgi:hypothetical protein